MNSLIFPEEMPQLVLQLIEGLENDLSYNFVFLSIFLLKNLEEHFLSNQNGCNPYVLTNYICMFLTTTVKHFGRVLFSVSWEGPPLPSSTVVVTVVGHPPPTT